MNRLFLLVALLSGSSCGAQAQAKDLSAFNDRAAGVRLPAVYQINELTCGTNGKQKFLFCMPVTQITSVSSQKDIFYFIQNYSDELKKWNSDPGYHGARWSSVLFSNLSGVVFDPKVSEPELNLERGAGELSEDEPSLYLRLPKEFSLNDLRKWTKKKGQEGWGDEVIAKLLQSKWSDLSSGNTLKTPEEKNRFDTLYAPGKIRVRKVLPGQPEYQAALKNKILLEAEIQSDLSQPMKELLAFCEEEHRQHQELRKQEFSKLDRTDQLIEQARAKKRAEQPDLANLKPAGSNQDGEPMDLLGCLRENQFSGSVLLDENERGECRGSFSKGVPVGVWVCEKKNPQCLQAGKFGTGEREEIEYRGGVIERRRTFKRSQVDSNKTRCDAPASLGVEENYRDAKLVLRTIYEASPHGGLPRKSAETEMGENGKFIREYHFCLDGMTKKYVYTPDGVTKPLAVCSEDVPKESPVEETELEEAN